MVYVTAVLKMGLESLERSVRNVFTSFLSLFALVVHVAMAILRMLFIHVHTDIHEWDMRMQLKQPNMTL